MEQLVGIPTGTISTDLPWFRGSTDARPFTLSKLLTSKDPDARSLHCTAAFPWNAESLKSLWDGHVTEEISLSRWRDMINQFAGSIVIGSTGKALVLLQNNPKPLLLKLPEKDWEVRCAAWALRDTPMSPLVVICAANVIFVFDVKTQSVLGRLRGHGRQITSIAVHPTYPYLFCTTSMDFTTRIYDLTLAPLQHPNNLHWLPETFPSRAGPAHGLQLTGSEGEGLGQCVVVLVGERSGGHRGTVFCAAWHPFEPLIATCGMDRAVKIWRMPPYKPGFLSREDKPLFSTDWIHKARVLSIHWLSGDILVSHSAPALMREDKGKNFYEENGTVVIWQWLGFDRFFPPNQPRQTTMRGCASDYRNSDSFKVLSAYHLPLTTRSLAVYKSPSHDPVIMVPIGKIIRVINLTHFQPRQPAKFPPTDEQFVASLTSHLNLGRGRDTGTTGSGEAAGDPEHADEDDDATAAIHEDAEIYDDIVEDDVEGSDKDKDDGLKTPPPRDTQLTELFSSVGGWDVEVGLDAERREMLSDIETCEMAFEGNVILGAGARGTLYMWRLAGP